MNEIKSYKPINLKKKVPTKNPGGGSEGMEREEEDKGKSASRSGRFVLMVATRLI